MSSTAAAASSTEPTTTFCDLCGDELHLYGAFQCGHYSCHKCALRVRGSVRKEKLHHHHRGCRGGHDDGARSDKKAPCCPVCRSTITQLVITEKIPPAAAGRDRATIDTTKIRGKSFPLLNCIVADDDVGRRLMQLVEYVCPFEECWSVDPVSNVRRQDPFVSLDLLQKHLSQTHQVRYCDTCLHHGVSFLSELTTYSASELPLHAMGLCPKDVTGFQGHPKCLFCSGLQFQDGDALLHHMKHKHFVCDFCNRYEYKFVYYKDRDALEEHWMTQHRLCTHHECAQLTIIERIFDSDFDLARHMSVRHGVKMTISADMLGFTSSTGGGGGAPAAASSSGGRRPRPTGPRPATQKSPSISCADIRSRCLWPRATPSWRRKPMAVNRLMGPLLAVAAAAEVAVGGAAAAAATITTPTRPRMPKYTSRPSNATRPPPPPPSRRRSTPS